MLSSMSEERRDTTQEEARRVLSPVRVAVLLLLGAFFLVIGGSRADAAEAAPAPEAGPGLLAGTLSAVGAGPELTAVGGTVDGLVDPVVDPVLAATEPVLAPVVAPVQPVLEPAVAPLRPVVERVAPPVPALPLPALPTVVPAPPEQPLTAPQAGAERTAEASSDSLPATDRTGLVPATGGDAAAGSITSGGPEAPVHPTPATRPVSTTNADGGTAPQVPHAVLFTALLAVVLLVGGVVPRTSAPPLAPSFLPPVFPG
jgi:hypothetical protein